MLARVVFNSMHAYFMEDHTIEIVIMFFLSSDISGLSMFQYMYRRGFSCLKSYNSLRYFELYSACLL